MTRKKTDKQATPRKSRQRLVFEELEPRLLLSADLPVDIPAMLTPDRGDDEPLSIHEEITTTAVTEEQYTSRELVFVDTDTPDYQLLVDDLLGNSSEDLLIEVVLLENSSDGITQITSALSEYRELDAVHIISHGGDGSIDLGGTLLGFDTLLANTKAIQGWAKAFSESGDLLIYGCNLAATETGQALVNSLARLTGADVAASDDLTGSAAQGGDWELEYQNGYVETSVAFSEQLQQDFAGVLATVTLGDGASPGDRGVWGGGYAFTASAFTLATDIGTDTLTDLTVAFSGTDVNDVNGSGVKLWRDDGTTANLWDESDTQIGSAASFTGTIAGFSGLSESINTAATQYLITYDIAGTATATNTLQGSITAATVSNPLINNDTVDATLTVEADLVHETSVYKMVYAPGIVEELYLKNTSSPTTNVSTGMSIGSVYATTPGSLLMTWDPDATVTTIVDNSAAKQVQMSGRLMHTSGVSYGSVTTNITFYEDRVVFDMSMTMDVALANEWMFMSFGTWDDALLDESFEWSSNNSGIFNTADPASNFNSGNQASPISYQGLFEMGGTDGLVSSTMQNISNYGISQIKNTDNDSGSVDIAYQKNNPVLLTTYQASVQYSFDSTSSGFNTITAEERQDDFVTPAILNFGITGGDGVLVGDGYSELRGVYTLDDNDADDHVRFDFETTTNHHAPAFEISNWDGVTPDIITVDGEVKLLGTDYNAAVSGTTLYLQYLGDISANTRFEIGNDYISGALYSDEGATAFGAGSTVRLLVNGVDQGTATTDANGRYAIFTPLAANDTVLVYVDGDDGSVNDGTTVTIVDGDGLTGLDIFIDHLITRHDNAGVMTNVLLDTADGAGGDAEILYSLDGSNNLTVNGSNSELYVQAGHTFTPGADVVVQDIEILGTVVGDNNNISISGNWISSSGTFIKGTSNVLLNGTGTLNSAGNSFYNLTTGSAAQVTTLTSDLTVTNVLTIADSTGALTDNGGGYDITVTGTGTPFINNGAAVTAKNFIYKYPTDATITAAGGTYNVAESLYIAGSGAGSGTTYRLNGDLLVNGGIDVYATSFGVSILDTLGHSITANNLQVSNSAYQVGFLYANDSTIDINGDVAFINSVTTSVNLGSSDWFVYGDWTNNSNTFDAGSSTVSFDGSSQTISGSNAFYNFAKIESTNDATDSTLIFDNTEIQTINGTLTLDGLDTDDRINLISNNPTNQWSINLTATAIKGTMDYLDVTDSDASGSDVSHKLVNPSNSFNSGNNIDWFGNSAPTIGGTVGGQAVNDNATIVPFNSVVIGDNDVIQTLIVTVTLDVAAKGVISTLNGFTDSGGGVYTFSGTAAAATSAIQGLVFDPADNRVALGSTETTNFTINVEDGIAAPAIDATTTVVSTSINDAPVLAGANGFGSIAEDAFSNSGTLVSDLIAAQFSDGDVSALSGIAITGTDNTNGIWQYSMDGGSNWLSLGSPSLSEARLLASDAITFIRFVPSADFNGAVSNGITFHAWDQTTGNNGDLINISGFDAGADGFDVVSYSNNDGSTNWATDWVENDNNGGGASGGFISIDGGSLRLQVSAGDAGDNIYREIDLSGASTATLAFDFHNLLAGEDEIRIRVSGDGGASYASVYTLSGTQNTGSDSVNLDISSYIASDTRIQLYVFKNDAGDDLFIDNLSVSYDNGDALPGGETAFSAASQGSDITVTPVNDAPVAVNDSYNVNEGSGGFLPPMGLLLNDSDIDSGSLTAIQLSNVTHGSLSLNPNGSWWYTPDPDYYGLDSFTYKVNDGSLDSNIATVTLNIVPRNDAPTGSDNTVTTLEDTDYVFSSSDFGFSDPVEGDALLAVRITTLPGTGTLTLAGSGAVTAGDFVSKTDIDANKLIFTPVANANGTGYASFTFQVQDNGGTANSGVDLDQTSNTLTIDITVVNDAPIANNDIILAGEDSGQNASAPGLMSNDTDAEGAAGLSITAVNGNPTSVGSTITLASGALLTVNADGSTSYNTNGAFEYLGSGDSAMDSFTYTISDAGGLTSTASVTVFIPGVNDAPVVVADSFTVNEGSATNLNLTVNDTDADDGLDLTSITIVGGPTNGSIVVNADGTVDYTHDGSETLSDNFTYTINDASGATSTVGTVNLSINPVNDTPIHSIPAAQTASGNTPLSFSNLNGNGITVTDPDASGAAMEVTLSVSNGTLSLAGTSGLSFNVGDGSSDATMTFTGTVADINAALNGLRFQPDADYEGMAEVKIITDDLGNVGTGGALNALDRINITVTAGAPTGIAQDTLLTLDELILEDMLGLPASVPTVVNTANVDPAAEQATHAVTAASAPVTTPSSDPAVDAMLGSGRGVATQADISLPGLVQLFDQDRQPHDDDRPSSVRLIGHVIRQGLVDPFSYAKILNPLQPDAAIWESIEAMMEQMGDRDASWYRDDQVLTTTTATGLTVSFTVGYVSWLLRAGYLSASLMSVLPLWRGFDPLPVLATSAEKKCKSAGRGKGSQETNATESESIFTSNETV